MVTLNSQLYLKVASIHSIRFYSELILAGCSVVHLDNLPYNYQQVKVAWYPCDLAPWSLLLTSHTVYC